jgi:hypothetical protein
MEYDFLKSGSSNLNEPWKLSHEETVLIYSYMRVYMETAVHLSLKYITHCCRTEVTAKDAILALKYVALQDKDFWEDNETKKKIYKYIEEESKEEDIDDKDLQLINKICNNEETKEIETNQQIISNGVKLLFPLFRNSGLDATESIVKSIEAVKRGIEYGDKFCESICPCEFCVKMNAVTKQWDSWKPETSQAKIIHTALQKTITQFNDENNK